MLRSILLFSTVCILVSCGQNQQAPPSQQGAENAAVDSLAVLNDPKNNLNIQTNSFSEIDSSGILMFPLSMGESEREGSSLTYKSMPSNSFWNIVFLNSKTNEYHLLSEQKMLIKNYDQQYSSEITIERGLRSQYIFYSVITEDFNKDKKLTEEDPSYLFVSDKAGKNFRQISPAKYNLQNWQLVQSANKIIMTVKKDSDGNSKFDDKDEVTSFEVDIDKGTAPREIFSTDFKNKLKILYDRDWKRLKN